MKTLLILLLMLPAMAMGQFAQLSSSETQLGSQIITFNQVDGISGMSYHPAVGLSVDEFSGGVYVIMAAPQVITGQGCYNTWMTLNGNQVANSNVQYCSQLPHQTDVIISQGAGCFADGDVINFEQSGTGIKAIFPVGEPQIPSIIFTAFRTGDC
jgi:hypothetical protein